MLLSKQGLDLLEKFEGLRLVPYNDSSGFATIGYGHLLHKSPVSPNDVPITQGQADTFLLEDSKWASDAVNQLVKVSLTQNQFDALVDFVYNLGYGTLERSTVLELINESKFAEAAQHMLLYNESGGHILPGLVTRRTAEVKLFLS